MATNHSPQLAITKVALSAVLLRQDPTACSRGEVDEFFAVLDTTIARCSPANVQKSKQWMLKNLVQSPSRVAALGNYLKALANSFDADVAASRQAREPASKRKRLHVLYILNDVLHHVHVRQHDTGFASRLEAFLPALVRSAAAFPRGPKHVRKVLELVQLWGEKSYFSVAFAQKLENIVRDAPNSQVDPSAPNDPAASASVNAAKTGADAPYLMPAMHGDVTMPWYDLPAANWLPVMEPNSTRPMNPSMVKPLQFKPGPADKKLANAVKDLLADVNRIYAKDHRLGDDPTEDIDQLGQRIVVDEITGDIIGGDSYYGWSRNFCDEVKQRRRKANGSGKHGSRGRSTSRSRSLSPSSSRSRSSSRPAFKRRRMSGSYSPVRNRSRSRSWSRSRRDSSSRDRRRSRSYSRSRSRTPTRDKRYPRSRSASKEYSPPPAENTMSSDGNNPRGMPGQYPQFPAFPPPNFPFPGNIPPPPPQFQPPQGGWPASAPPPPWNMPMGGWVPPPPPVPPMSQPPFNGQHHQPSYPRPPQYGRGGNEGHRGSRAGWRGGGAW